MSSVAVREKSTRLRSSRPPAKSFVGFGVLPKSLRRPPGAGSQTIACLSVCSSSRSARHVSHPAPARAANSRASTRRTQPPGWTIGRGGPPVFNAPSTIANASARTSSWWSFTVAGASRSKSTKPSSLKPCVCAQYARGSFSPVAESVTRCIANSASMSTSASCASSSSSAARDQTRLEDQSAATVPPSPHAAPRKRRKRFFPASTLSTRGSTATTTALRDARAAARSASVSSSANFVATGGSCSAPAGRAHTNVAAPNRGCETASAQRTSDAATAASNTTFEAETASSGRSVNPRSASCAKFSARGGTAPR